MSAIQSMNMARQSIMVDVMIPMKSPHSIRLVMKKDILGIVQQPETLLGSILMMMSD